MSTIYISWYLTILQAVKNGRVDILTHSALKRLVEEQRHAIEA